MAGRQRGGWCGAAFRAEVCVRLGDSNVTYSVFPLNMYRVFSKRNIDFYICLEVYHIFTQRGKQEKG